MEKSFFIKPYEQLLYIVIYTQNKVHIFLVNEKYLDHAMVIFIILIVCKQDSNPFYYLVFWHAYSDSDESLVVNICWKKTILISLLLTFNTFAEET